MTTTKQTELLPCPFCGTDDLLGFEQSHEGGWTVVKCRKCGASGSTGRSTTEAEAVAYWNRRAQSAPEPVQGEAVEIVGYQWLDTPNYRKKLPAFAQNQPKQDEFRPLMTVAQHNRIMAAAKPDAELVRQCIAQELATWEGDFQGPVQTAMRCLQVRIDAKLASLKGEP